jgi:hypothetical protein
MSLLLLTLTSQSAAKPFTGTCELPLRLLKSTIGTISTRGSVGVWLAKVPPGSTLCPSLITKLKALLIGPVAKPVSVVSRSPADMEPG